MEQDISANFLVLIYLRKLIGKAATVNGLFDYPWGSEFDDENNPINEIRSSYANYLKMKILMIVRTYEPWRK